jgi:hypothetical protein
MPSELKSQTARINGAKSHGPKTPQGRATSSVNATTHGLTAKTLILSNEDPDHFLEMLRAYFDLLLPANAMEVDLVSDIMAARWLLRRIWRYQTAMLDVEMDLQAPEYEKHYEIFDEDMRGAAAFSAIADNSSGYATALRTDIHLTRTYRKSDRRTPSAEGWKYPAESSRIAKRTHEPEPNYSECNSTHHGDFHRTQGCKAVIMT